MKMVEAIAKRLSTLMDEKKISQYELAKRATIDASTIYNIIYGRVKTVTIETLWLISVALDMTVQQFLDHPLFDKDAIDIPT